MNPLKHFILGLSFIGMQLAVAPAYAMDAPSAQPASPTSAAITSDAPGGSFDAIITQFAGKVFTQTMDVLQTYAPSYKDLAQWGNVALENPIATGATGVTLGLLYTYRDAISKKISGLVDLKKPWELSKKLILGAAAYGGAEYTSALVANYMKKHHNSDFDATKKALFATIMTACTTTIFKNDIMKMVQGDHVDPESLYTITFAHENKTPGKLPAEYQYIVTAIQNNPEMLMSFIPYGPSGVGKTTIIKQIARDAKLDLVELKGSIINSTEFKNGAATNFKRVGESLRKKQEAGILQPYKTLTFYDEGDAGLGNREDTKDSTDKNATLGGMNFIETNEELKFHTGLTTNDLFSIDPAALRRLDNNFFYVSPPDKETRKQITIDVFSSLHYDKYTVQSFEQLVQYLADETEGYTIADLKTLVRNLVKKHRSTSEKIPLNINDEILSKNLILECLIESHKNKLLRIDKQLKKIEFQENSEEGKQRKDILTGVDKESIENIEKFNRTKLQALQCLVDTSNIQWNNKESFIENSNKIVELLKKVTDKQLKKDQKIKFKGYLEELEKRAIRYNQCSDYLDFANKLLTTIEDNKNKILANEKTPLQKSYYTLLVQNFDKLSSHVTQALKTQNTDTLNLLTKALEAYCENQEIELLQAALAKAEKETATDHDQQLKFFEEKNEAKRNQKIKQYNLELAQKKLLEDPEYQEKNSELSKHKNLLSILKQCRKKENSFDFSALERRCAKEKPLEETLKNIETTANNLKKAQEKFAKELAKEFERAAQKADSVDENAKNALVSERLKEYEDGSLSNSQDLIAEERNQESNKERLLKEIKKSVNKNNPHPWYIKLLGLVYDMSDYHQDTFNEILEQYQNNDVLDDNKLQEQLDALVRKNPSEEIKNKIADLVETELQLDFEYAENIKNILASPEKLTTENYATIKECIEKITDEKIKERILKIFNWHQKKLTELEAKKLEALAMLRDTATTLKTEISVHKTTNKKNKNKKQQKNSVNLKQTQTKIELTKKYPDIDSEIIDTMVKIEKSDWYNKTSSKQKCFATISQSLQQAKNTQEFIDAITAFKEKDEYKKYQSTHLPDRKAEKQKTEQLATILKQELFCGDILISTSNLYTILDEQEYDSAKLDELLDDLDKATQCVIGGIKATKKIKQHLQQKNSSLFEAVCGYTKNAIKYGPLMLAGYGAYKYFDFDNKLTPLCTLIGGYSSLKLSQFLGGYSQTKNLPVSDQMTNDILKLAPQDERGSIDIDAINPKKVAQLTYHAQTINKLGGNKNQHMKLFRKTTKLLNENDLRNYKEVEKLNKRFNHPEKYTIEEIEEDYKFLNSYKPTNGADIVGGSFDFKATELSDLEKCLVNKKSITRR